MVASSILFCHVCLSSLCSSNQYIVMNIHLVVSFRHQSFSSEKAPSLHTLPHTNALLVIPSFLLVLRGTTGLHTFLQYPFLFFCLNQRLPRKGDEVTKAALVNRKT